jgi:cell division protein FtsB
MFIGIAALALWGLNVNIKTISLNQKMQTIQKKTTLLKEQNKKLMLRILSETSLEKIEKTGVDTLGMERPKEITYLYMSPTTNEETK